MRPSPRDRLIPHSNEAEMGVLGAMLYKGTALEADLPELVHSDDNSVDYAIAHLSASDFYREQHRHIFTAMAMLHEENAPVDVITCGEVLRRNDKLLEAGDMVYLKELVEFVPSVTNLPAYVQIVREKAMLRKLIAAGDNILNAAYNNGSPANEILESALNSLRDIVRWYRPKPTAIPVER